MDATTKLYTTESGEAFSKQPLEVPSEKSRGKQKRRAMKPKSSGQKGRRQTTSATAIMLGIKHKEELLQASQKENSSQSTATCISRNRITQKLSSQKVGIYSKGKASSVVTRSRKTLGDLSIKLSNRAEEATQRDIRRVLGLSLPGSSKTPDQPSPSTHSPAKDGETSSTDMDCSPHHSSSHPHGSKIREISHRLAEGMKPAKVFQGTDYLSTVKAELRKVMKQSDPEGYSHLMECLSEEATPTSPPPPSPTADQSFTLQACRSPSVDSLSSLALLFGSDSDTAQPHTLPSSAIPVQHSVEVSGMVVVATDIHQHVGMPTDHSGYHDRSDVWRGESATSTSMDFLDILDGSPQAPPTDLAPPKCPPPTGRWMPTPDRPRMFPRKLY